MWSTERKRFTDSQWNALTLMTKEGPVQYEDGYGVRVGTVPHTHLFFGIQRQVSNQATKKLN